MAEQTGRSTWLRQALSIAADLGWLVGTVSGAVGALAAAAVAHFESPRFFWTIVAFVFVSLSVAALLLRARQWTDDPPAPGPGEGATPAGATRRILQVALLEKELEAQSRDRGLAILDVFPESKTRMSMGQLVDRLRLDPRYADLTEAEIVSLVRYLRENGYTPGLAGPETGLQVPEDHFAHKTNLYRDSKRAIGLAALRYIESGMSLGLDGGSTTLELARALFENAERGRYRQLSLVSNSVPVLNEFLTFIQRRGYSDSMCPIRLLTCAGWVRPNTHAVAEAASNSSITEESLTRLIEMSGDLDCCFVGANGVTVDEGVTMPTDFELHIKRLFLSRSKKRYVLVDSSKFGVTCEHQILDWSSSFTLIVDHPPHPSAELERIEASRPAGAGWEIVRA